jgi:hypothetical protein
VGSTATKVPQILKAVRYQPADPQVGLRGVTVAGKPFHPKTSDFYRDLIDHRTQVRRRAWTN